MHRAAALAAHLRGPVAQRAGICAFAVAGGAAVADESPLDAERARCSFPVAKLMHYVHGGRKRSEMRELVAGILENDSVLVDPPGQQRFDMNRAEIRRRTMAKISHVGQLVRGLKSSMGGDGGSGGGAGGNNGETSRPGNDEDAKQSSASSVLDALSASETQRKKEPGKAFTDLEDIFYELMGSYDASWATRIGVHFGLFMGAIQSQGTEEQVERFLDESRAMRILGCFAMTELGHGSYVQGMETTATFDASRQEFVIHSPTITSTKFWIGLAGQTATHAVVFAQLVTQGRSLGVHPFVVQIRDVRTGLPMPGVSVGDCGSKMGRDGVDNGWIRFNRVRIPRTDMLMRWAQVAADGSYSKPPLKQITYNSLISGRVDMVRFSSHAVQKAVTIAIRYGCVRRQFPLHGAEQGDDADAAGVAHSKPAPAAVATAGGGLLEERKLMDYQTHQLRLIPLLAGAYALHFAAAIVIADFQNFQSNLAKEGALDRLGEIHATAAGLKAVATWYANDAIEHCRQCLGGNGYSAYSELPAHRADWAVMCTWEGDNTVMMKQCARFLVKQHRKRAGSIDAAGRRAMALDFDPRSSAAQVAALQHVANRLIAEAAQSNEEVDLVRAARAHCNLVIVQSFGQGVREAPAPCRDVLKRLCDLHACVLLEQSASELQEDGYATGRHVAAVRRAVRLLCAELRPEAVGLVDAFGIPDFILGPFGARDGKIYERFFAQVTSVPGSQDRPPYWEELIKPLTSAPPTSS